MTLSPVALIIAALLNAGGGFDPAPSSRQPGVSPKPEPTTTLTPTRVFTDARDAARDQSGDASDANRDVTKAAPIAERLTVTVKGAEQSAASANIVLRIAPGKERDRRDSQVSIDAGPLRIYARGGTKESPGEVTAVSTANPSTYYRVPLETPPTVAALSSALLPLPLPTLAIYFAPEGEPLTDPTPLTRGIAWQPVAVPVNDLRPPITLTGTVDGKNGTAGNASIHFEYQQDRLRVRSFSAPVTSGGADARTLSITVAWIDPGDPKSWTIDVTGRTRVETLGALGTKIEPPAPPEGKKPDETPPKPDQPKAEPPKSEPPKADPPSEPKRLGPDPR
jgi:hypothetical protein